jgi:L-seryl-tRNA(Ser) seleniumtransferase
VDARRAIPSIERLLSSPEIQPLLQRESRARVTDMLRAIQQDLRVRDAAVAEPEWYAAQLEERLDRADRPSLREVINATGVILHTNLGRAPLSDRALAAIAEVARGYNWNTTSKKVRAARATRIASRCCVR